MPLVFSSEAKQFRILIGLKKVHFCSILFVKEHPLIFLLVLYFYANQNFICRLR